MAGKFDKVIDKINTYAGLKIIGRKYDNTERVWMLNFASTSATSGTLYCFDLEGNIITNATHTLSTAVLQKYAFYAKDDYVCIAMPDTSGSKNYTWVVYKLDSDNNLSLYRTSGAWGNYAAFQCGFMYKDNNDEYWIVCPSNSTRETPAAYNITTNTTYRTESSNLRVYAQYYQYVSETGKIKGLFWNLNSQGGSTLFNTGYKEETAPYGAKTMPGANALADHYYALMFPIFDYDNNDSELLKYEIFLQGYVTGTTTADNYLLSAENPENLYLGTIKLPHSSTLWRLDMYGVLHDGYEYWGYNMVSLQIELLATSDYLKCMTYEDIYQGNPYFDYAKSVGCGTAEEFYDTFDDETQYPASVVNLFDRSMQAISYGEFNRRITSLNISLLGSYKSEKPILTLVMVKQEYLCSTNGTTAEPYRLAYYTASLDTVNTADDLYIKTTNAKFSSLLTTTLRQVKVVNYYDSYLILSADDAPFLALNGINDEMITAYELNSLSESEDIYNFYNTTASSVIRDCTGHVYEIGNSALPVKINGTIYSVNRSTALLSANILIIFKDWQNNPTSPPSNGSFTLIVNGETITYSFTDYSAWTTTTMLSGGWVSTANITVQYFNNINVNYCAVDFVENRMGNDIHISTNTYDNTSFRAVYHIFDTTKTIVCELKPLQNTATINYSCTPDSWTTSGYCYKVYDSLPTTSIIRSDILNLTAYYTSKSISGIETGSYLMVARKTMLEDDLAYCNISCQASLSDDYILTLVSSNITANILVNNTSPFKLFGQWFGLNINNEFIENAGGQEKSGVRKAASRSGINVPVYTKTYTYYEIPTCFVNLKLLVTVYANMTAGILNTSTQEGMSTVIKGFVIYYDGNVHTCSLGDNESSHVYTIQLSSSLTIGIRAIIPSGVADNIEYTIHARKTSTSDIKLENAFAIIP